MDPGARVLVVIHGVPGSGKTSLASELSSRTGLPHVSKDGLKEHIARALPCEPTASELSRIAGEVLWDLVAEMPSGAIVETWFGPTGRDAVERGSARAGIDPRRVMEIWCEVPVDVAHERFRARLDTTSRPSRLDGQGRDDAYWADLENAAPLGLARVRRVPTNRPVDAATLTSLVDEVASLRSERPRPPA